MAAAIIKVLNKAYGCSAAGESLALHNTHGRTAQMLMKLATEHGNKTENGLN